MSPACGGCGTQRAQSDDGSRFALHAGSMSNTAGLPETPGPLILLRCPGRRAMGWPPILACSWNRAECEGCSGARNQPALPVGPKEVRTHVGQRNPLLFWRRAQARAAHVHAAACIPHACAAHAALHAAPSGWPVHSESKCCCGLVSHAACPARRMLGCAASPAPASALAWGRCSSVQGSNSGSARGGLGLLNFLGVLTLSDACLSPSVCWRPRKCWLPRDGRRPTVCLRAGICQWAACPNFGAAAYPLIGRGCRVPLVSAILSSRVADTLCFVCVL